MINHINLTLDRHVITVEDPIEYYHYHKKSIINQREVGVDVTSFAEALVAIRGPADAQLAVQSERIRVWESLVEGDGLRAEAWNMNATAAIQLIRGRRNLGELGELIREERELIAEQGRLLADAWSSRVQPMVQPSTAAYAHPHAHPHDSSILTSPGAGSRRGLTLYP